MVLTGKLLRIAMSLALSLVFIVSSSIAASAAPTPSSGPVEGGTNVAIPGVSFTQISTGNGFTLALTSTGHVYAWGKNHCGQLGQGGSVGANCAQDLNPPTSSVPVLVKDSSGTGYLSGVTQISAGADFAVAVTPTAVYAWGLNETGQLGDTTTTDRSLPVAVHGLGSQNVLAGVTAISAGAYQVLALTSAGLIAWGNDNNGAVGASTPCPGAICTSPVEVEGINGSGLLGTPNSFLSKGATSLAIMPDGSLLVWGDDWYDFTVKRFSPTVFTFSTPIGTISKMAVGGTHALFLTNTGLWASGSNGDGQLGNGTTTNSTTSSEVFQVKNSANSGFLSGVTSISAGGNSSYAVTASSVFAWGDNGFGQLGDNSTSSRSLPVQVLGLGGNGNLEPPITLSAEGGAAFANFGAQVYSWGFGYYGSLGDGLNPGPNQQKVPKLGANFTAVSVLFGTATGTQLATSNGNWTVTSPAGAAGQVDLNATANIFGGTTAGSPSNLSWNAGTFTYTANLPATGAPNNLPLGIVAGVAVLLGVGLLIGLRKLSKK